MARVGAAGRVESGAAPWVPWPAARGALSALLIAAAAILVAPSLALGSPDQCPAPPASLWPLERPNGRASAVEDGDVYPRIFLGREPVEGRYIVRVSDYRDMAELRVQLAAALGPEGSGGRASARGGGWAWVDRAAEVEEIPTDFAVIVSGEDASSLSSRLSAAVPGFRDVHADMRLTRTVHWVRMDTETGEVIKHPGRPMTRPSMDEMGVPLGGTPGAFPGWEGEMVGSPHRDLAIIPSAAVYLRAESLWSKGFTGRDIRVGVFDTSFRDPHPHLRNIHKRTNWTTDPSPDDGLGHGSFVAGVIAGIDPSCPGFAPDAGLWAFKVFTDDQQSYTSWLMDAFNYAIHEHLHILNLSIGGPDYLDLPFTDKIREVTANGIIMISAMGNDGPSFGTANNPADQGDVIGVGGVDWGGNMASFSSRGMTLWEMPERAGRVKPDVVAYGAQVLGSDIRGGCRSLSGTSVASPVVAGSVALLASTVPEDRRWAIINPGSMKQALIEGATRVANAGIHEAGAGLIDLHKSAAFLQDYQPRASLFPASLDLTAEDCPYMWPYCASPVNPGRMPLMINASVINGMGVVGHFSKPPTFTPTSGPPLQVSFEYSESIWPWSGWLSVYIEVEDGAAPGTAAGIIAFEIESPPALGEDAPRRSTVTAPLRVTVVERPPREKIVLWDQYHSIKYPPAYIPSDGSSSDMLDWHGDHLHTNFRSFFDHFHPMRGTPSYYLEILGAPYTCFDASKYGTLLVVDPEAEFAPEEVEKLRADVEEEGLSLVVFSEWYNVERIAEVAFFDDNTRSVWQAATGGANVPALNELLQPFKAALGNAVVDGNVSLDKAGMAWSISSGSPLAKWPAGGWVHKGRVSVRKPGAMQGSLANGEYALLGVAHAGNGTLAVAADASCLDGDRPQCLWLADELLSLASGRLGGDWWLSHKDALLLEDFAHPMAAMPERPPVPSRPAPLPVSQPLTCPMNAGAAAFTGPPVATGGAGASTSGSTPGQDSWWQRMWNGLGGGPGSGGEVGNEVPQPRPTAAAGGAGVPHVPPWTPVSGGEAPSGVLVVPSGAVTLGSPGGALVAVAGMVGVGAVAWVAYRMLYVRRERRYESVQGDEETGTRKRTGNVDMGAMGSRFPGIQRRGPNGA